LLDEQSNRSFKVVRELEELEEFEVIEVPLAGFEFSSGRFHLCPNIIDEGFRLSRSRDASVL
jgi:hypothetical protein